MLRPRSDCKCFDEDDPHRPDRKRTRCRFKAGKSGQHLRVVDRASLTLARAYLSDVDMMVLNRTLSAFSAKKLPNILGGLETWVKDGLPGMESPLCRGAPLAHCLPVHP